MRLPALLLLLASGALWAQFAVPYDTNTGNASPNTVRVVLATNQPNLTSALNVSVSNSSLAVTQSGTWTNRVVGNAGAAFDAAEGAAAPANAVYVGGEASGNINAPIACDHWTPIDIVTATTTKVIALASAKTTYICSFHLFSAGTDNAAWISGTKVTNECDTGTVGLAGGATAASGYNFTAQTGISASGGWAPVIATAATGKDVCIITSAAVQLSGTVNWTQF